MKNILLLTSLLTLGANVGFGYGWITPPPSSANPNSNFTVSATGPAGGVLSYLVLWKKVPAGAWSATVMGTGMYGTISGSSSTGVTGTGYYNWQVTVTTNYPSGSTPYGTQYATAATTCGTPITAATIASFTYNGSAQSPTSASSVTPSGATVSVSAPAQTNAGTYNTATVTGTGNYFGTLNNVSWTINARSTTFSLNQTSFTYSGASQGPTILTNPSGASFNGGGTLSAVNANNNYVATAAAYGNYTGSNNNLAWSIAKANQSTVSISPGNQTVNAGSNVGFTASGGGMGGYTWGGTSGASGTGTTKNVGFPSLGTFTVTAQSPGDSNYNASNTASVTITVSDSSPPSVPGGLAAGGFTSTSFTLSWSASTDNVGVTAYEVRRDATSLGTTSSTSMSITGLSPNNTYTMSVRARDAAGNWSSWSSGYPVSVSDVDPPSIPTGLSATNVVATSFTLSWNASSDNVGVTGYEVFKNGVSYGTTSGTSLAITSLTQGTTYSMTVRARDAVPNWSAQSTALPVIPLDPNGDFDGDGLPNSWEQQHGLNPLDPSDAADTAPNGKSYSLNFLLGINPAVTPTSVTPDQLQLKVHQP